MPGNKNKNKFNPKLYLKFFFFAVLAFLAAGITAEASYSGSAGWYSTGRPFFGGNLHSNSNLMIVIYCEGETIGGNPCLVINNFNAGGTNGNSYTVYEGGSPVLTQAPDAFSAWTDCKSAPFEMAVRDLSVHPFDVNEFGAPGSAPYIGIRAYYDVMIYRGEGQVINLPTYYNGAPWATNSFGVAGNMSACTPPPPTLTFNADLNNIYQGDHTTLRWTSSDAISCTASGGSGSDNPYAGGWAGNQPASGTYLATPEGATTYTLRCTGPSGNVTASVIVTSTPQPANAPPPPTVAPDLTESGYCCGKEAGTACGTWDGYFYSGSCQNDICDETCRNTWVKVGSQCMLNRYKENVDWPTAKLACETYNSTFPTVADLDGLPCAEFELRPGEPASSWGAVKTATPSGSNHLCYHDTGYQEGYCTNAYDQCGIWAYSSGTFCTKIDCALQDWRTDYGYVCLKDQNPDGANKIRHCPTNGACVTYEEVNADGETVPTQLSSAPTELCTAGTPSLVSGEGPWTWTCQGIDGGQTSPTCSAAAVPPLGACGTDSQQTLTSPPTNLCTFGTASAVSGDGSASNRWTWTCTGDVGAAPVNCSADLAATPSLPPSPPPPIQNQPQIAAAICNTGGLVPCGCPGNPCTLCHLIIGFKKLIEYGMIILLASAIAAITIAGIMYMVSSGSEPAIQQAKSFLKAALIGLTVVLAAWLIVFTVLWGLSAKGDLGVGVSGWNTFTCSVKSSVQ